MTHKIEADFMGEKRTISPKRGKRYEVKPMNIVNGKNSPTVFKLILRKLSNDKR